MPRDPYEALGLRPDATDAELRSAYRRLVLLHHPDHNAGSKESEQRFEEVQEAYAEVRRLRSKRPGGAPRGTVPPRPESDPDVERRMADIERELREAQAARERARAAAQKAAADARRAAADARKAGADARERPSDEELGYVTTDDSFSKILADARDELFDRIEEVRESPAAKRVSDLIDELAAKLTGEQR
jgi:curved DNA-binding protein CbpA